jgi:hypothetical protein
MGEYPLFDKKIKVEVFFMNPEMQFLPYAYRHENEIDHSDERIFGRPFGRFGFGGPFLGGLAAGTLLSPYGYGGYGGYGSCC